MLGLLLLLMHSPLGEDKCWEFMISPDDDYFKSCCARCEAEMTSYYLTSCNDCSAAFWSIGIVPIKSYQYRAASDCLKLCEVCYKYYYNESSLKYLNTIRGCFIYRSKATRNYACGVGKRANK